MDKAIGSLLDKLEAEGLDENTIIVFVSDNGGSPRNYCINKPLKDYKYNLYEGGIRVPYFISWPGHIPAGKTLDNPVSTLDILPTIASLTGGTLPSDREYDGINLMPVISGRESTSERVLCWKKGRETNWAIRKGDMKLIEVKNKKELELYNLKDDLSESNNLAKDLPDVVNEMTSSFRKWENKVTRHSGKYRRRARK
jgi:arylsulfatase A-like enzyme